YYDLGRTLRSPVSDRWANRYALRRQAWWAGFLSGACGYAYGAEPIWRHRYDQTTWQAALMFESRKDLKHFRRLTVDLPWWTLKPDSQRRWLTGGGGTYGEADFAVAAVSDDRRLAVLYTPVRQELTLDPEALAPGTIDAHWYDPSDGSRLPVELPATASVPLRSPKTNHAGDPDFVLVVRVSETEASTGSTRAQPTAADRASTAHP
ncbi:MAG: DUF4038 domain-containing protein, partial [Opitutales bacterium]